jgi:hypothetical protein
MMKDAVAQSVQWAGQKTNQPFFPVDGERFVSFAKFPDWSWNHAESFLGGTLGHFYWRQEVGY